MVGVGEDVQSPGEEAIEELLDHLNYTEVSKEAIGVLDKHLEKAFVEGYVVGRGSMLIRIREYVEQMPKWDKRSVPGGFHVKRQALLDYLTQLEKEDA